MPGVRRLASSPSGWGTCRRGRPAAARSASAASSPASPASPWALSRRHRRTQWRRARARRRRPTNGRIMCASPAPPQAAPLMSGCARRDILLPWIVADSAAVTNRRRRARPTMLNPPRTRRLPVLPLPHFFPHLAVAAWRFVTPCDGARDALALTADRRPGLEQIVHPGDGSADGPVPSGSRRWARRLCRGAYRQRPPARTWCRSSRTTGRLPAASPTRNRRHLRPHWRRHLDRRVDERNPHPPSRRRRARRRAGRCAEILGIRGKSWAPGLFRDPDTVSRSPGKRSPAHVSTPRTLRRPGRHLHALRNPARPELVPVPARARRP